MAVMDRRGNHLAAPVLSNEEPLFRSSIMDEKKSHLFRVDGTCFAERFIWLFAPLFTLALVGHSFGAAVSPSWPDGRTRRIFVRVDPIDIGKSPQRSFVASTHVEFAKYLKGSCDLSSLMVRQYNPETGEIIDHRDNALATTPGELPLRFYDDQIPWMYPDHEGYCDPQTGVALPIRIIPGGGRFFNTIGDGRSGKIAWAHTQTANNPSFYEISFSELPAGAGQRPPPAGWLGDGINRCLPDGGQSTVPVIHAHVAVGDLSGDGLFDMVVGNATGTLFWYQNHGTKGHPQFDTAYLLRNPDGTPIDVGWSAAPEIVDWDGDGLLDLIVGCEKESILFYKNIGDRHHPAFKLIGPVQADGKTLRVPHNYCDMDPQNKIYPVDYEPVPHVVDWNGDGKLDLLAGGYITGRVFYYENIAASAHEVPKLSYRGPLQADGKDLDVTWCAAPCTGDFRHCGKLDLISGAMQISPEGGDQSDPKRALWYYENVGTRANPVLHHVPFPSKGQFPFGALATPRAIDITGNGLLDLVTSVEGEIYFIRNIGTPTQPLFDASSKPLRMKWGAAGLPYDPQFVDFTHSGHQDIFDGRRILVNSGRGNPGIFDSSIPLPGAEKIQHPTTHGDPWDTRVLADVDGDGLPDILVADTDGYIWFHRNIGTKDAPRFDSEGVRLKLTSGEYVRVGIPPAGAAAFDTLQGSRPWVAVIDMNHTGLGDLAGSDEYGKVHLFLHDPSEKPGQTPRFQTGIELPSLEPVRLVVRKTDWNHDGWDDLIYGYANDRFCVLLNEPGPNGTRRFGPPQEITVPGCYGDPYFSVADFNGDGDNDLIINQYGYTRFVEQSFIEHGYIEGSVLSDESR
jgi:hypothetical protein